MITSRWLVGHTHAHTYTTRRYVRDARDSSFEIQSEPDSTGFLKTYPAGTGTGYPEHPQAVKVGYWVTSSALMQFIDGRRVSG